MSLPTFRILCLHGCCQTSEMCKSVLKNFIEICNKDKSAKFEFYFMEGKYVHPDGGKTWYNKPLVVADIGNINYDENLVKDTLEDVHSFVLEKDINILMGFSQGGNVVDTYLHYHDHPNIKKAVILSSYSLNDPNRNIVDDVSVLNLISECDTVVPHHLYPKNYTSSTLIMHDKGHKIPGNPIMRQVKDFIIN